MTKDGYAPNARLDPGRHFQRLIVSRLSICIGSAGIIGFIARSALPHFHPIACMILVLSVSILAIPFFFIRKISIEACGILLVVLVSSFGIVGGFATGGLKAPGTAIMIVTPLIGFFVSGRRGAVLAGVLGLLQVAVLLFAEKQDLLLGPAMQERYLSFGLAFMYVLGAITCYAIGSAISASQAASRQLIESLYTTSVQQTKMASLGEISAGIAHEINNPLAIISGTLPLLEKARGDEAKLAAKVEGMARAVSRIAHIVKSLKRFSRSTDSLQYRDANLRQIVDEAVAIAKLRNRDVRVESQIPEDLSIFCDAIEIEQVVINLLNNAIDAAIEQDDSWVKISALQADNQVVLRVMDSGPALDPQLFAKLFQPFYTTKPVGQGTGLGLSICKGILDQHKAKISLSRDVANTCFEISFPVASGGTDVI